MIKIPCLGWSPSVFIDNHLDFDGGLVEWVMYTSAELQLLRNALAAGTQLPGIDYTVGNLLPTSSLVSVSALGSGPGWSYDATNNLVRVSGSNVILSGIDFGSAEVMITGNNVTLNNCTFEPDQNWFAVYQYGSGATIENCTFTGNPAGMKAGFIGTTNPIAVINNVFTDASGDAIDVEGGATVTGNYVSGAGYSAVHSDGVWITNTSNGLPTTVTNNFIDFTLNDGQTSGGNNTIRITSELGPVSNVTVTGNYLLGGSYSITVGSSADTFSNVLVAGNYVGFSQYGDLYPSVANGVVVNGNAVIIDWRNVSYSTTAWAAYSATIAGAMITSTGGNIANSSGQYATVYGGYTGIHTQGGIGATNLVGGYGRQFIDLGLGANIVTELSISDSSALSGWDVVGNFDTLKDVIDLSNLDADLVVPGTQSFVFIGTAAFSGTGAQVRYYQDGTNTYVEAKLAGDTTTDLKIQVNGLVNLSASNFALTAAQSATAFAAATSLTTTKTVAGAANSMIYEYNYAGVLGQSYADYQTFLSSGKKVALNFDYGTATSITSNGLEIVGMGAVLTRGASGDLLTLGTANFNMPLRASETLTIDAGASAKVNLQSGFGNETISGFDVSSSSPDTLNLSRTMFSYLTPSMTDSQALAALISNASATSSGLTVTNSYGDKLTLAGVDATTLAAASNVHFV